MKANYEEDKVVVSATEPTGLNRKKVWFKKGKNLFDKTNYIIDSTNKIGFILNLKKGETYTVSSNLPLYVAKFAISSAAAGNDVGPQHWGQFTQWTFTAGNNANNILNNILFLGTSINTITSNISDLDDYNIQIEKGSTTTTYEEYVESEIYILNSNDVYEKFEENKNSERVLFENSDGVIGDITLIENITNYSYIEIYYKQNDGTYGYTKCVARNNAHIDLTVNHITNNGYANSFSSRTINIYNNTIKTLNTNRYISGNITSDNNLSGTTATNNIYITKVVGYK